MKPALNYRADIDGLRAIAVLSVLLFHYGATWLPGGFAGVDVFFVISGYLITKHLADDIRENGYAIGPLLVRFYDKRIRRIVPALIIILAATISAGWFLLMPGDYATSGQSAAYSAFGLGNLYFYWNTGYFDREAEMQPLLHMWSLGVEEQFYLVWPVLLALIMWLAHGKRIIVASMLATLVAAGLAHSLHTITIDPKAAFFLPLPRAWELGVGAFLAFIPPLRSRLLSEAAGIFGVALIGWALFTLAGAESSLGLSMLPAVLGSALIVWPQTETLVARALAIRPLRFVGLMSYSLYLWHWPILVLFRHYANGSEPTLLEAAILAAVAFFFAYLSWRFIETPARRGKLRSSQVIWGGIAVSLALMMGGKVIVANDGFTSRIPSDIHAMSSREIMWEWPCEKSTPIPQLREVCVFGTDWQAAKRRVVLWGDSHSEALAPQIENAARRSGTSVAVYYTCAAIADGDRFRRSVPGNPDYDANCNIFRTDMMRILRTFPEIDDVILASSWRTVAWGLHVPNGPVTVADFDGSVPGGRAATQEELRVLKVSLQATVDEIRQSGQNVFIVGHVPGTIGDPVACAVSSFLLRADCPVNGRAMSRSQYKALDIPVRDVINSIVGAQVIVPGDALCSGLYCSQRIAGEFIYRDQNHLRRNLSHASRDEFAKLTGLVRMFEQTSD